MKYLYLFWFGGSFYITLETIWRGYSHWSMGILAGIVFIIIGLLNEIWGWETGLIKQALAGSIIATIAEFITGCIVNLWLGWNIWDYSDMPGNIIGQVCTQLFLLWIAISLLAIVVDDVIRWRFYDEEKPRYYIGGKKIFEFK